MLPKKERLDRETFDRSFSVGKRFHSPSLTLIYVAGTTLKASAVMGKRIGKTAVVRNKFRRRIYDVFERLVKEKKFGGIFICIAKAPAQKTSYEALKEELHGLIHKTGVLG